MASQDMPPAGGFGRIYFERTHPKPIVKQGILFLATVAMTYHGIEYLIEWRKRYRIILAEQQEHYIAAHPFMVAEQERKFLTQLWHIREEERELMKDHPGWKLGTLYGEQVYKTLPKGSLPQVSVGEFVKFRPNNEWTSYVVMPDFWN